MQKKKNTEIRKRMSCHNVVHLENMTLIRFNYFFMDKCRSLKKKTTLISIHICAIDEIYKFGYITVMGMRFFRCLCNGFTFIPKRINVKV